MFELVRSRRTWGVALVVTGPRRTCTIGVRAGPVVPVTRWSGRKRTRSACAGRVTSGRSPTGLRRGVSVGCLGRVMTRLWCRGGLRSGGRTCGGLSTWTFTGAASTGRGWWSSCPRKGEFYSQAVPSPSRSSLAEYPGWPLLRGAAPSARASAQLRYVFMTRGVARGVGRGVGRGVVFVGRGANLAAAVLVGRGFMVGVGLGFAGTARGVAKLVVVVGVACGLGAYGLADSVTVKVGAAGAGPLSPQLPNSAPIANRPKAPSPTCSLRNSPPLDVQRITAAATVRTHRVMPRPTGCTP